MELVFVQEVLHLKRVFIAAAALIILLTAGCTASPAPETTLPQAAQSSQQIHPSAEYTPVPSTTETEAAASTVNWNGPNSGHLYSYEDYFAFERFYFGVREDLQPTIVADNMRFEPIFHGGRLVLRDLQQKVEFPVEGEGFTDLQILGTDGFYWIYCIEAGQELFRIDPFGNRQTLCVDESAQLTPDSFRLEDYGNLAVVATACGNGYDIYRIHLPTLRKELIAQADTPVTLGYPVSNYQIVWFEGEEKHITDGQSWDISDSNIALFQNLLSPGKTSLCDGMNNWFNMATMCQFSAPQELDLRVFFGGGFAQTDPWLTKDELEAYGLIEAIPVARLDAEKMERVLQEIFGIGLAQADISGLASYGMYDADTDTYCMPLPYFGLPEPSIYYPSQELQVHKVVYLDGGLYKVYYLPVPSSAGQSSQDLTENVMILQSSGNSYRILSNQKAVQPSY